MGIKFGILGTAEISARSLIAPLKNLDNAELYGVASRSENRARKFAETHNVPNTFSSYEALLNCDEIDAVYIPLINSIHAEWVVKTANVKKHILVEKPICMNVKELEEIRNAAKRNGVYLLEGMMMQYSTWQKRLKQIVDDRIYGKLKALKTRATYRLEPTETFRVYPEKGGGVFFEEGILWCELTQLCCGLKPRSFYGKSDFSGPNGIDATFEAKMVFPNGISSELLCSYQLPYTANHWIEFDKAHIMIRNFWKPCFGRFAINFDITHLTTKKREKFFFEPENYYENQLNFFVKVIEGKIANIPFSQSYERIVLLKQIYDYAKRKRGGTIHK